MSVLDDRTLWVDYLKSFITALVVAHHASLSYTTFASFDSGTYINSTHVIVDSKRWIGLDIFQNFNDVFFMSLMFFISGLYLFKSIEKKGMKKFIKDRIYRLLIPFLLLGTFLMLLSYFPSYMLATGDINIVNYVKDFFIHQRWPTGPPWFIWLLFFFSLILVIIYPILNRILNSFSTLITLLSGKPYLLILAFSLLTWILYVPLAYAIGAGRWVGIGPFDFQVSRLFLYSGYFLLGALLGGSNTLHLVFSDNSALIKLWKVWIVISIILYTTLTIVPSHLIDLMDKNILKDFYAWMIYYTLYILSCVFNCIVFITLFNKFVRSRTSWWDSLSENAYLIYMTHFVFIVWSQYVLLDVDIPVLLKFIIVFIVSILLSWLFSILLRKIPIIRAYM